MLIPNPFHVWQMTGGVYNWELADADAFGMMLLDPDYVFSHTHEFVSDIVANEIVADVYSRQNISGRSVVADDDLDRTLLMADDVVFPLLGSDPEVAVGMAAAFMKGATDAARRIMVVFDNANFTTNSKNFTVIFENGIYSVRRSAEV